MLLLIGANVAVAQTKPLTAAPANPATKVASAAPGGQAATLYTGDVTPLLATAGGKSVGDISPGTPVNVMGTSGKFSQVTVQGWSTQKGPSQVYSAVGQRINMVSLSDAKTASRTVGKTTTDDYKAVWENVTVTGWVTSTSLMNDQKTIWSHASALYSKSCSACHAAHQPTDHTANEWIGVLKGMTPRTSLTKDQVALILKYLQTSAKK
ncbi:hypothetical protein [Deinococcus psychrotolerans]|nr:hypothetical protein [Deinococcus psychrotolerans]